MDFPRTGAAVELREVEKSYALGDGARLVAVADLSLSVEARSTLALMGPSGSGKSTLLHLVGGLDQPDRGEIEVGGVILTSLPRGRLPDYRRHVGFVFQRFNLLPAFTALENVVSPVLPYDVRFDKAQRARDLLAQVGLAGREDALPSRLSGGEQQRVAIARALMGEPELLLADEPTGNLDSHTGTEVLDLLLSLREQRGMTVLIATHDPAVAARCDRMVRLLDGRLVDDVDVRGAPPSPDDTAARLNRLRT